MSAITKINEIDRETQKGFATGSSQTSVETAGPLASLPQAVFSDNAYDEFSSSNPFAHGYVDYSNYSQAPETSNSETSYSIAMANMLSAGSGFECGDVSSDFSGGFDSGFSGGDCGFSGGGSDSFSASC